MIERNFVELNYIRREGVECVDIDGVMAEVLDTDIWGCDIRTIVYYQRKCYGVKDMR